MYTAFTRIFALSLAFSFIMPNLPVLGTSPALLVVLELLLLVVYFCFAKKRVKLPRDVAILFGYFFFFCVAMTVSFVMVGATVDSDVRYLISLYSSVAWLPLIYLAYRNIPDFQNKVMSVFLPLVLISTVVGFVALAAISGSFQFLRIDHSSGFLQQASIFGNANQFARLMLAAMSLVALVAIYKKYDENRKIRNEIFVLCALTAFIVLSGSRANLAASVVFWFGFYSILNMQARQVISKMVPWLLIPLLVVLVVLLVPGLRDRFSDQLLGMLVAFSSGADGVDLPLRLRTWLASIDIIQEYPVFGIGYSQMEEVMGEFGSVRFLAAGEFEVIQVHGGLFKIVNFGGFVALGAFMLFLAANLVLSSRFAGMQRWPVVSASGRIWRLYLIVLMVGNISGDSFGLPSTWIVLAFLSASTILAHTLYAQQSQIQSNRI